MHPTTLSEAIACECMPDEAGHKDTFTLIYEGEGLKNGEMDVFDLAPALLAIGETFRTADEVLNGSATVTTTSVRAEFQKGSFEVVLAVEQHLRDSAAGIIPALHVIGAEKLISTVVGSVTDVVIDKAKEKASSVVSGLFKLLGKLGGAEPKEIQYDEITKSNIFLYGNNNTIHVDQSTTELYRNQRTRKVATRVAVPLRKSGIKSLKANKEGAEIASVERKDFPELESAMDEEPLTILAENDTTRPSTAVLIVRIVKPDFKGDKWTVSEGDRKTYTVSMADEAFKSRVHARKIGFFDGDMYRVRMETEQKLDGRGLRTIRRILQVIESVPQPRQQSLKSPEDEQQGRKFRDD